jgi:hypothetical protein
LVGGGWLSAVARPCPVNDDLAFIVERRVPIGDYLAFILERRG